MKIVETDNFDGDSPDETFVNLPSLSNEHAIWIAAAINSGFPEKHDRWWKVVPDDYKLKPGFEP